ncbi:hypothetical protein K443DRAFT_680689 [Laccaria amethystina LaAM-08-1]|uniref:Uncharacterized protein n=1 Tax=Laccaria amethystina LaAM-08-1 TaxID=1095629 RepID=A0A0C9XM30_9AGAR|nr:hypothetical protein K443DRAFT_680689 [Laccaria amethystina LaAM-08-1]
MLHIIWHGTRNTSGEEPARTGEDEQLRTGIDIGDPFLVLVEKILCPVRLFHMPHNTQSTGRY